MTQPEDSVYRVLLVSSSAKFNQTVSPLLSSPRYPSVMLAASASEAGRRLLEESFDIVIVNAPLPDETGTRLALDACEGGAGVLLLVRAEYYPELEARVSACGVLLLAKPTSLQLVSQSLGLLCATRERLRRMERKTATIEEKMAEIRLVNRAKWLLIERVGMTEPDAHRYIEKAAMDRCITKRAVAESIVKTYR